MTDHFHMVKVLSARYDVQEQFLVMNCHFKETGQQRIVCMHKSDFTFHGDSHVPDVEMKKTARLMTQRQPLIKLIIADDPNRRIPNEAEYDTLAREFQKTITHETEQVVDGLKR